MSSRTTQLGADTHPPGWNEAIAAALRAAPEVSPAVAETVAGLLVTHEFRCGAAHRQACAEATKAL